MTRAEYAAYEERVSRYLEGCEAISTGPCPGCEDCQSEYGIGDDKPDLGYTPTWFSWRPCEICNTPLGGDREDWHCVIDGKIVHGSCCEDCAYYLNYGRLDDMTMANLEE